MEVNDIHRERCNLQLVSEVDQEQEKALTLRLFYLSALRSGNEIRQFQAHCRTSLEDQENSKAEYTKIYH